MRKVSVAVPIFLLLASFVLTQPEDARAGENENQKPTVSESSLSAKDSATVENRKPKSEANDSGSEITDDSSSRKQEAKIGSLKAKLRIARARAEGASALFEETQKLFGLLRIESQPHRDASKAAYEEAQARMKVFEAELNIEKIKASSVDDTADSKERLIAAAEIEIFKAKIEIARARERRMLVDPESVIVSELPKALKKKDWQVRSSAAKSLGKLGPKAKRAVPALIESIKDDLVYVTGELPPVLPSMGLDSKGIHSLKPYWEHFELLRSEARVNIAEALGEIGKDSHEAVPTLLEIFRNEKEFEEVRKAAAEAIKKIGTDFPN